MGDVFVGEGTFPAALAMGAMINLEDSRDAGPWVLLGRLRTHAFRTQDVQETIRWGLIGAGMEHGRALDLVSRYVQPGALMEYVPAAITILYAALYGPAEDPIEGEPEAPTNDQ